MEKVVGIYKITNLVNGKSYIGQSIDVYRRFWDHRSPSHESNKAMREDMKTLGKDNFRYEIVEECLPEELDEKEIYYIQKFRPEYNRTRGGQNSYRGFSEDTIQKLRQSAKNQWASLSEEEWKEKVARMHRAGLKRRHLSEETKQKLRERNLGKKQDQETINKRRETLQTKKKNGWKKDGRPNFKQVICTETGEVFESVKSAAERIGARPTTVSSVLKGRQKTAKGLHFEYYKV